jgi:hypothetical protein
MSEQDRFENETEEEVEAHVKHGGKPATEEPKSDDSDEVEAHVKHGGRF